MRPKIINKIKKVFEVLMKKSALILFVVMMFGRQEWFPGYFVRSGKTVVWKRVLR